MFNGTSLALSSDVDQDTHEKVTKHERAQHTGEPRGQRLPSR